MENDVWSTRWSVPVDQVQQVRSDLAVGLKQVFNSPASRQMHAPVNIRPCDLVRPVQVGMWLLDHMGIDLTPLPADVQQLIANTTPQHRTELFDGSETILGLACYDGRAMYMGCCSGLGYAGGRWRWSEGEDIHPEDRGRARVEFFVPLDWEHVGLLAVKRDGGNGWYWPSRPMDGFEAWADCSEIRLARQCGWPIQVREKIVWPEGDPLGVWAKRLSRLYLKSDQPETNYVSRCSRMICLHTIGWMHNLGYADQRSTVAADDPRVNMDTIEWQADDGSYQIRERVQTGKRLEYSHPEWSAGIWSRARLRIAKALLETPREQLIAVRGDAIYRSGLVVPDPGRLMDPWRDDGDVGRMRLRWEHSGPMARPTSWAGEQIRWHVHAP